MPEGKARGAPKKRSVLGYVSIFRRLFMTFAWYGHVKELNTRPWIIAALVSWGIAFFEYILQAPTNRLGFTVMSIGQLKILQEVIALSVFAPFALPARTAETRLPMGGLLHPRGALLHLPRKAFRGLITLSEDMG